MKNAFDVVVVGGGPAGSTVATYLARAGFTVAVLEKETFPRFHVGESLLPFCYELFEDLGVLDKMKQEFPRKPGVTFSNEDNSTHSNWCFGHLIKDESHLSFHVERSRFDHMLLNNAADAGVTVQENVKVVACSIDQTDNRVSIETQNACDYEARFFIDASGQDCFLGTLNSSRQRCPNFSPRMAVSNQWSNAKLDTTLLKGGLRIIHLEGEKKGWLWMIPVAENKLSVGVVVENTYYRQRKKELVDFGKDWQLEYYRQEVFSTELGKQILASATVLNDVAVNGDYSYQNTDKYGDHYAAIGDASAFLDPMFASGVYMAMKSAKLVAEAVIQTLNSGDKSALEDTYQTIGGAYALIEKMINTYYDPDAIKFADAQHALSYSNREGVYSIMHLLLAGDFFANQDKYNKTLAVLNSKRKIDGFLNLSGQTEIQRGELCE